MPAIQRRREQAKRAPFEETLGPALLPNFSGAMAGENTNHLLIEMPLRIERTARSYLGDVHAGLPLHAVEMDECSLAAGSRPGSKLQLAHIVHAKTLGDGNTFTLHPLAVAGAIERSEHFFEFRFHACLGWLISFYITRR